MSALDDIEAATAALNALTVQEAAQKAGIDASVAAALAAISSPYKVIYLDAAAGLDTNDGSTAALAVQTPGRALGLIGAGQLGRVLLLSDVTVTAPLSLAGSALLTSNGALPDGTVPGGVRRKITFAPASMTALAPPYPNYALNYGFGTSLSFFAADVAVGAITSGSAVIGTPSRLEFWYNSLSFDPAATVPLIFAATGASVFFNNVTLPSGYGGKIFAGYAAGANPNSASLRTNLTSA